MAVVEFLQNVVLSLFGLFVVCGWDTYAVELEGVLFLFSFTTLADREVEE